MLTYRKLVENLRSIGVKAVKPGSSTIFVSLEQWEEGLKAYCCLDGKVSHEAQVTIKFE